jgi:hypothetical protein
MAWFLNVEKISMAISQSCDWERSQKKTHLSVGPNRWNARGIGLPTIQMAEAIIMIEPQLNPKVPEARRNLGAAKASDCDAK